MKRVPLFKLSLIMLSLWVIVVPSVFLANAAQNFSGTKKVYGSQEKDKALVYVIRRSGYQSLTRWNIFAGRQLLGVIGGNSYSFINIEPGHYTMWVSDYQSINVFVMQELEFVPGQTYYLDITGSGYTLLPEQKGKILLNKIKKYTVPDDADKNNAKTIVQEWYQRAKDNDRYREKYHVNHLTNEVPEKQDGLLRIPEYTPIRLCLMQNLSSVFDKRGDSVAFQIMDDVIVDGLPVFAKGNLVEGVVREARCQGAGGTAGVLDVVIPTVMAGDGTDINVVGQIAMAGASRSSKMPTIIDASIAVNVALQIFGPQLIQGGGVFQQKGEEIIAWTRGESWVDPTKTGLSNIPSEVTGNARLPISSNVPRIYYTGGNTRAKNDVEIQLETEKELEEIVIRAIDGFCLPRPLTPSRVERNKRGVTVVFKAWELMRYLNLERISNDLVIEGILTNGRPCIIRTQVMVIKENGEQRGSY